MTATPSARPTLIGIVAVCVALAAGCASEPPTPEPAAARPEPAPRPQQQLPRLAPPMPIAEPVRLRDDRPQTYTVVRDDTLWDIAARFLHDPWVWPEIWQVNPQISNPHLIYPGDIITLRFVDGQPQLYVERPGKPGQPAELVTLPRGSSMERLSPRIREESINEAIPMIPSHAIRQFTVQPRVVDKQTLESAPYIIGNRDGRLISASGNRVYARGINRDDEALYSIFRPGKRFIDPQTGETLGYEAIYIANAKVTEFGDPSILVITDNNRETLNGDRLLPLDKGKVQRDFIPSIPDEPLRGQIISLYDAISQVGQNQVVVINRGQRDGVEAGHVLAINAPSRQVKDRYSGRFDDFVQLPESRSGIVMIFRSFDRISYGLIMEATHAVHVDDIVTNP